MKLYSLIFGALLFGCVTEKGVGLSEGAAHISFDYTNVAKLDESILIVNDSNILGVFYSDLDLAAEIRDDHAGVLLAFTHPYNIQFFLPGDLSEDTNMWTYKDCRLEILDFSRRFYPPANQAVSFSIIEQKCEDRNEVVRYEYSDYYGIQSIAIGHNSINSGEDTFRLENYFALYGSELGFGASHPSK